MDTNRINEKVSTQRRLRYIIKVAVFAGVGYIVSAAIFLAGAVGGGGYPMKYPFIYIALPALCTFLVYLFLRKTWFHRARYIIPLFLFLVFFFQFYLYGFFIDKNMDEAQAYMEVLIEEVERFYKENGYYPEDLSFVSEEVLAEAESHVRFSEDKWQHGEYPYQYRIGMFFLTYTPNADSHKKPLIEIGRRDERKVWNWDARQWE